MDTDGDPISACFGFSHLKAGADMAKHVIGRVYGEFAYVGSQGGLDLRATKRFEAFARVVQEAGAQLVASQTFEGASSMDAGRRATNLLLQQRAPAQAIYFANDDLAAGGLMHCLAEGLATPGDVALAGFNGLSFLSALPRLIATTVTPRFDIGQAAAQWLLQSEKDAEANKVELPAELKVGQTT